MQQAVQLCTNKIWLTVVDNVVWICTIVLARH